ncbi:MAG: hypothetical protein NTX50_30785 [Candidatus Sumerlaeota bacterium]|nr:hypothetical protein [Candidatus Sumerlaeota bacterium]
MNTFYRYFRGGLLAALIAGALLAPACTSRATRRETRRFHPVIAKPGSIQCYVAPVPQLGYIVLAIIDTDSVSTLTASSREQLLKQMRQMASEAGAEKVYDLHLLTRQTQGLLHDPNAPKWALAPVPGWTDTYFLRGKAVIAENSLPENYPQFLRSPQHPAPANDQGGKTVSIEPPPSPNADPVEAMDSPTWVNLLKTSRYQ